MNNSCANCHSTRKTLLGCTACKRTMYCGKECQKMHWQQHKPDCKRLQKELEKMTILPSGRVNIEIATSVTPGVCGTCRIRPDNEANANMCISCGDFLWCGHCAALPRCGAKDGRQVFTYHYCGTCAPASPELEATTKAGTKLQNLLQAKPTGRHVLMTRLMIAQCQLYESKFTGLPHDVNKAFSEFKRLANEDSCAYAQFIVGGFYDPQSRDDGSFHNGPLNFDSVIGNMPPINPPCTASWKKALKYYRMAADNNLTMAITTLGTFYKNGDGVHEDKARGFAMLKAAADEGDDPRAMCNAGQMLMRGFGIPMDIATGVEYYRKAATKYEILSAKFMMCQVGLSNPQYADEGYRCLQFLKKEEWEGHPGISDCAERFEMITASYDRRHGRN